MPSEGVFFDKGKCVVGWTANTEGTQAEFSRLKFALPPFEPKAISLGV